MPRDTELLKEIITRYGTETDQLVKDLEDIQKQSDKHKQKSRSNTPKGPVVASLHQVTKTYKMGKNKVEAVKDISFDIHEGEIVALIGPSGSGKSSILNLIGGLDRPTSGTVSISGQDLSTLSDAKLSNFRNKFIGFVFQFFYLQPFMDVKANVGIPMMFSSAKKQAILDSSSMLITAVGLEDRANHMPKELSGGQIQRTAIARALVNSPKLVLADEPTGNLDRKNGDQIMELFEEIRETYNTAILLVTHDERTAARADRIITLEDGAIV